MDKLDATGFAILLRNGTLPEVWVTAQGLKPKAARVPRPCWIVGRTAGGDDVLSAAARSPSS
jgi:hypothetical protein